MTDLINFAKENLSLEPHDKRDVFLILCSINFLNAMIKKNEYKDVIHYGVIKPRVSRLFDQCIEDNTLVDEFFFNQKERCAYIRSYGLQFSFHNIKITEKINVFVQSPKNKVAPWDRIPLQPIAEKLFQMACGLKDGSVLEMDLVSFVKSLKERTAEGA
jgi:hypothetical protein